MRRTVSALVFMATVLVATLSAQSDAAKKFVGRWEGQRQAEGRLDNVALVVTATDKGLTGQVIWNGQPFDAMTNIVVDGKHVAFDVGNMSLNGTIDGATLALTAHYQDRDLWSMTLTRKAGR